MRRSQVFAAIFALYMLLCVSAYAATTEWMAKMTSSTKVYSSASTSSSVKGSIDKNTRVTVLAANNGWSKIKLNGNTGFVKSSTVTQSNRTMYVKSGYVHVYASNSSSSSKLATFGYGTEVSVKATQGDWAMLANGSAVGFCKTSGLTSKNPNGSGSTVYTKWASAAFYAYPSSSAPKTTASYTSSMKYYCTYDGAWCRVKLNGVYGYIKKSDLSTKKYDGYSTAEPTSAHSVKVDWFTGGIQSTFSKGKTVVITDVKTGISWKVKRTGGIYHADCEPLTAADTRAMKKACGSDFNTWERRAVWVSIGSKKYAASINCMPHGTPDIKNNNFAGVFCVHFVNSKTHCSEVVDSEHQKCINYAYSKG